MRNHLTSWIFGAALGTLVAASGAAAQDLKPEDPIVVTGQPEIPRAQAKQFIREVMTTVEGQFARFREPVCPTMVGIGDEYGAIVSKRIRLMAQEAGIPIGGEKCAPNIIIIVAADADRLVKDMRNTLPTIFAGTSPKEMKRALRSGPVHVWSAVEVRNEDGQGISSGGLDGRSMNGGVLQVRTASMLELSSQQATVQSVIVIDDDAMLGKTLAQLGDYVAMRTLASARPPKAGLPADTILTLFDPTTASPAGATQIDRSYLKGLYQSRPTGRGSSQANTIARTISNDSRERVGLE
ncbi:hypothetical protein [Sphingomonas sp. M1-B02]|uniref:hypothetical protein n=1 Tax=Sphingomonas sp. M1-B02 TaxID=3114300 RepID=UPI00223EE6E9|nr:hypothetical protein [Sphingomonas sp. S6-11]UZK66808.1 hypothetical protein OKW87_02925 [Sphingomonas sp. S6-11]